VGEVIAALVRQLAALPKESIPAQVEVSFGIKATSDGAVAVTLTSEADLHVRLMWGGSDSSPLSGLLPSLPTK
jgi:hypothetical protein